MATIGSLALAIRARTEQLKGDLKPALDAIKHWGEAARAAGADSKEVERAMARMRMEAMQGRDMAQGPLALEGALRKAKVGAAALSGAISAVSSEVGGAVGHVTRLGTSLTSAFLAGGPIALGVTALAAGIAAITGANQEAAKAAEEAQRKHREWLDDSKKRALETRDAILSIRDANRAKGLGSPELAGQFTADRKDAEAMLGNLREQADARREMSRLERERAALVAAVPDWVKQQGTMGSRSGAIADLERQIALEKEKLDALNTEMRRLEEKDRVAREGEAIGQRQLETEAARNKMGADGNEAARKRVEQLREQLEVAQELREVEASRAALERDGMAAARDRVSELMAEREAAIEKQAKDSVGKVKSIAKGMDEGGEAAKKWVVEQENFKKGLRDELQLLQAANRYERERIEIRRRLAADLKRAAGDAQAVADAEAIAAERMKEVAHQEAAAAKEKAEAERQATLEKQKQMQLLKEQVDITKRFANFGGKSPFGFGQGVIGSGLGDITGAIANQKYKAAAKQPGGGAVANAAVPNPPTDVSPRVEKLVQTIQAWAVSHEKTAGAIGKLEAATQQAFERSSKATEKAVATVARGVKALEAKVREHDRQLQRAAAGAGVGPS